MDWPRGIASALSDVRALPIRQPASPHRPHTRRYLRPILPEQIVPHSCWLCPPGPPQSRQLEGTKMNESTNDDCNQHSCRNGGRENEDCGQRGSSWSPLLGHRNSVCNAAEHLNWMRLCISSPLSATLPHLMEHNGDENVDEVRALFLHSEGDSFEEGMDGETKEEEEGSGCEAFWRQGQWVGMAVHSTTALYSWWTLKSFFSFPALFSILLTDLKTMSCSSSSSSREVSTRGNPSSSPPVTSSLLSNRFRSVGSRLAESLPFASQLVASRECEWWPPCCGELAEELKPHTATAYNAFTLFSFTSIVLFRRKFYVYFTLRYVYANITRQKRASTYRYLQVCVCKRLACFTLTRT